MPEARGLFALTDLVAFVTGAGSGIGQATAAVLQQQGATVAVNDISADGAQATCRDLGIAYDATLTGDVTDAATAARIVAAVEAKHGRIDILVNNAAAPVPLTKFLDIPVEGWPTHLSSLFATLACTRAALPGMVARGWGRVVNVTSFSGTVGVKDMVLYGAGKGGIHAFTAGLAKEVAATGVTINCVAPGTVDTPRQRARPEAERAERMARAPVGRFAEPSEIGAAVAFLAARESAYITGEILYVDGGRP